MKQFILFCCVLVNTSLIYSQAYIENAETDNESSSDGWGYGLAELRNSIAVWKESPLVTIDTIGYTVQNRPQIRVSIMKNGAETNQKYRIAIHARTHAAEVQSTYVTNEIISILLSNTELSNRLLDACVFNIVPIYNVDGVELGLARTNVNGVDIEGDWSLTNPEKEVTNLRALYKSYMNSAIPVRIALNMHSALACMRYFVCHHSNGTSVNYFNDEKKFIGSVRSYWPEGIQDWNSNVTWTGATPVVYPESFFWLNYHENVLALTYEDMNCAAAGNYDKTANALLNGISDYLGLGNLNTISNNEIAEMKISPNPAKSGETIVLKFKNNEGKHAICSIFSLNGKLLFQKMVETNSQQYQLVLPPNLKGVYILSLRASGKVLRNKIVIY